MYIWVHVWPLLAVYHLLQGKPGVTNSDSIMSAETGHQRRLLPRHYHLRSKIAFLSSLWQSCHLSCEEGNGSSLCPYSKRNLNPNMLKTNKHITTIRKVSSPLPISPDTHPDNRRVDSPLLCCVLSTDSPSPEIYSAGVASKLLTILFNSSYCVLSFTTSYAC